MTLARFDRILVLRLPAPFVTGAVVSRSSSPVAERSDEGRSPYEVRVRGRLGSQWSEWFSGLQVTEREDGETVLAGPIDQAALHGMLRRIRDLGLFLVSVRLAGAESAPRQPQSIGGHGVMSTRRFAIAAGVLFLVADLAGVLSVALSQVVRGGPDFLGQVGGHATELGLAALLEFVMGAAGAGIAIALYPALRPHNTALAVGAVAFRIAEAVAWMLGAAILMAIVTLGQDPARAGDPAWYQGAAAVLYDLRERVALVALLAFSLGAAAYYWTFFRARMLPRWLSGWGLLGTALWMAGVAWAFVAHGVDGGVLVAPLALNELALAAWLIVRGFTERTASPSAVAATAPEPAIA